MDDPFDELIILQQAWKVPKHPVDHDVAEVVLGHVHLGRKWFGPRSARTSLRTNAPKHRRQVKYRCLPRPCQIPTCTFLHL